jgi:hypothetical protein
VLKSTCFRQWLKIRKTTKSTINNIQIKMPKKVKVKNPFKKQVKKYPKREIIALIFALASVSFFILNAIYFLSEKDFIISTLTGQSPELISLFQQLYIILPISWIIFAILTSLIVYNIENKRYKWHAMLTIAILSLFVLRIDCFILGIIASILYIKDHK